MLINRLGAQDICWFYGDNNHFSTTVNCSQSTGVLTHSTHCFGLIKFVKRGWRKLAGNDYRSTFADLTKRFLDFPCVVAGTKVGGDRYPGKIALNTWAHNVVGG